MFEALRKYGSILMLVLMGLVLVCLIADEHNDAQYFAKQTAASICVTVVVGDFDLDDDDDDEVISKLSVDDNAWDLITAIEIDGQKTGESKCSQALLRGQVRRYSPRNGLAESHYYVISETVISGGEQFLTTFFVRNSILHDGERGLAASGSRSILQTSIL